MTDDHVIHQLMRGQERLEGKLDKLTDAITQLARMEERMAHHMDGMQRIGARLDKIEAKLDGFDVRIDDLERARWRLAGAVGVISAGVAVLGPKLVGLLLP